MPRPWPYTDLIAQGASNPQANHEFDAQWATGDGHNFHGAKNAFEILGTDDKAQRELAASAERYALDNEIAYAHDPNGVNSAHHLMDAGRLIGLNDSSMRDANMINGMDQHSADVAAYAQKKAAYDAVTNIGTLGLDKIPGADAALGDADKNLNKVLGLGGDSMKAAIIGDDPGSHPVDPTRIDAHDFERQDWAVMSNANVSPDLKAQYPDLFDNNGQLRSWSDLNASGTELPDQVYRLFNQYGAPNDGHGTAMSDAYRPIVETDPASNPQGKK